MSFISDYNDATKIQLIDNISRKDSKGNPIYRIIPWRVLNIAGVSYYEPLSFPVRVGAVEAPTWRIADIMSDFSGFQIAEEGRCDSYSPRSTNDLPIQGYF